MKKLLFILIILFSSTAFSQKMRFSFAGTTHFLSNLGTGFGAQVGAERNVFKSIYAGLRVEVLKFANANHLDIPITANLSVNYKKRFFISLEPGLNIANHRKDYGRGTYFSLKGGFYMFGGLGYMLPLKGKLQPTICIGASHFNYQITEAIPLPADGLRLIRLNTDYTACSVRLGITIP